MFDHGACLPGADGGVSIATAALDRLIRRKLVLPTDDAYSVQSHFDLAELAIAVGSRATARLLYELAFLRLGCSPAALDRQSVIASRTGLWLGDALAPPPHARSAARGSMVEIAVHELGRLIEAFPPRPPEVNLTPANDAPRLPAAVASEAAGDCATLLRLLRSPDRPGDAGALMDILARLKGAYADHPPEDLEKLVGAPLPRLIDAFARESLRRFAQVRHGLGAPPLGSPPFFLEAARLDPDGLGPFFVNVARVIRDHGDLFGLVHAAAGGVASDDLLERWIVILSTHVDPATLDGTVDVLGDLGMTDALWGILEVAARGPGDGLDHQLMFALRDAGLDLGDLRLAGEAQRLIAIDRRDVVLEWRILGEIHGTAGEDAPARQAFLQGLRLDPHDKAIRSRLEALTAGAFAPFSIRSGFGEQSRARRRGAVERRPDAWHPLAADPRPEPSPSVYADVTHADASARNAVLNRDHPASDYPESPGEFSLSADDHVRARELRRIAALEAEFMERGTASPVYKALERGN